MIPDTAASPILFKEDVVEEQNETYYFEIDDMSKETSLRKSEVLEYPIAIQNEPSKPEGQFSVPE